MGPTWVLSAPDVPYVGLMNLAIWVILHVIHVMWLVIFTLCITTPGPFILIWNTSGKALRLAWYVHIPLKQSHTRSFIGERIQRVYYIVNHSFLIQMCFNDNHWNIRVQVKHDLGNIFPWKLKIIYSNISFIDLNSFHISKTVSFIIIIYLLYAVTAC